MPVVEDSDQVLPLLTVGDAVETDEGPGVLTSVQFQTAQYDGAWELEPPSLIVELDSGETIHTCLCVIKLPSTQKGTRLLHQEFNRLWPPKTDGVPEDADMMIPEGDEEVAPREGTEKRGAVYPKFKIGVDHPDKPEVIELTVKSHPDYPAEKAWKDIVGWAQVQLPAPKSEDEVLQDFGVSTFRLSPRESAEDYLVVVTNEALYPLDRRTFTELYNQAHKEAMMRTYTADFADFADEPDIQRALMELFEAEDLEPVDFDAEDGMVGVEVRPIGKSYSPEFVVVTSYTEAVDVAVEHVTDQLHDEPELFTQSWLMHYIDEDRLRDALFNDEFDSVYDNMTSEMESDPLMVADRLGVSVENFEDDEGEVDEDQLRAYLTDNMDDLVDRETKEQLEDPVGFRWR